ncbi:MAG: tRNA (cytidine(34)-2'-O)-methyltransferase [Alphaproteobacteria bacterium]
MRIALYQPDIPQNAGAVLRLAACLQVPVDVIEPCGFVLDDRRLKRVAMDYGAQANVERHASWQHWKSVREGERMILLTTMGTTRYTDFEFDPSDILLLGRESAGVPADVHEAADGRLIVPMAPGARSLNVVTAAAMVLGEAMRQTGGFELRGKQTAK